MSNSRVAPAWIVVAVLVGAGWGFVLFSQVIRLSLPMTVADVVQIVIAAATGVAAWAAWRSARESQRATQATLYTELMKRYSSPEMADAVRGLAHLQAIAEPSLAAFAKSWAHDIASGGPVNAQVKEYDRYRRPVSHFFWDVSRLIADGLITDGLRDELLELSGATVMRDVVIVLEVELHQAEKTPSPSAMHKIERFLRVYFPGETVGRIRSRAAQKHVGAG
jgi:hypothetical protein